MKAIGKIIKIFALALGVLLLAVFLGLGVACLLAAGADDVDEVLKTAGIQAAVISFVLAILSPLFCTVLYAVGALICTLQKQTEDLNDMKTLLRQALSDGMLSDEVARKVALGEEKLIAQLQAAAPARPTPSTAPVQRYVEEPVEQTEEEQAPEVNEEPEASEEPEEIAQQASSEEEAIPEVSEEAEETAAKESEEAAPAPQPAVLEVAEEAAPVLAAPAKPAARTRAKAPKTPATATPLRPIGADDEVF